MPNSLLRRRRSTKVTTQVRGSRRMETTTIRDFSGGLNVADNDLSLDSRFASKLANMQRLQDGSIGLRYGTKLFTDLERKTAITGDLDDNPLDTTAASAVVTVNWVGHGLLDGHSVTFADLLAVDGIPASELNATHIVDYVDVDTVRITVTTTATAGVTGGGGTGGTYSYDNQNLATDIIFCEGFRAKVIAGDKSGNVSVVDANGNSTIVWSENISQARTSTAGWSTGLTFISATQFGSVLKMHNGVDKPIEIDLDATHPASYMVDPGSGANTNTPVGKYAATVGQYHCIAGITTLPAGGSGLSVVSISGTGTPNTFLGDAGTDAIELDVAKRVQTNNPVIRGIIEFRDELLVFFDDVTVPIQLGVFSGSTHAPVVGEPLKHHGAIGHKTAQNLGNDCLMCDLSGVPSIARARLSTTFRSQRASEFIRPLIRTALNGLSEATTEDRVISVYGPNTGEYILLIPNNDVEGSTTETQGFVYTFLPEVNVRAWARITGWNFRAIGTTTLGRVIMAKDREIYIQGTQDDEYYADYINDPSLAIPADGVAQTFEWELPWADFEDRTHMKHIAFIRFDAKGSGEFTCKLYVDNIITDAEGNDSPAVSMDFIGGDALGFGEGEQPFGGGRNVADERLFEYPAKCMITKVNISGTSSKKLQFVALMLYYRLGEIRR